MQQQYLVYFLSIWYFIFNSFIFIFLKYGELLVCFTLMFYFWIIFKNSCFIACYFELSSIYWKRSKYINFWISCFFNKIFQNYLRQIFACSKCGLINSVMIWIYFIPNHFNIIINCQMITCDENHKFISYLSRINFVF